MLLLDEPTAVLAPAEAEELLRVVRAFTTGGGAAVLITHKLDEALGAADRVTVLRQGEVVFTGRWRGRRRRTLAGAMIGEGGRSLPRAPWPITGTPGSAPTAGPRPGVAEDVELLRDGARALPCGMLRSVFGAGEIVGIAAVEGNGQRELLRAVAGRLQPLGGKLSVAGPVGYMPEDRTTEGLILEMTLTENVVLGSRADEPWLRRGRIDWGVARARTRR